MDNLATQPLNHWTLTLTSSTDFDDSQEDQVVEWHRRKSEMCLLVRELHEDGRRHYHSLIAVKRPRDAGGVMRMLETLYRQMNLDVTKYVTLKVKKMTDKIGFIKYLRKDVEKPGCKQLLLTGWSMSWIKETCLKNLKHEPYKMLLKDTVQLTKRTSTRMVLEFTKRSGMEISGKFSFADVIQTMMTDGYQFENTKMTYLYAQVMAQLGHGAAARNLILGELRFIDD